MENLPFSASFSGESLLSPKTCPSRVHLPPGAPAAKGSLLGDLAASVGTAQQPPLEQSSPSLAASAAKTGPAEQGVTNLEAAIRGQG